MTPLAATSWPQAAQQLAGIALVTALLVVVVWQVGSTRRARAAGRREDAYQMLATHATEVEQRSAAALEHTAAELSELRARVDELTRILKEVD